MRLTQPSASGRRNTSAETHHVELDGSPPGDERSRPPTKETGPKIAHRDNAMINQGDDCLRYSIVELLCPFCDQRHEHIWKASEAFPRYVARRCQRALANTLVGAS